MRHDVATRRVLDPNPSPRKVAIKPGYPPTVEPDSLTIHLGRDEEVLWECKEAEFKVIFKGESPFDDRVFSSAKPRSGRVRPDVEPDTNKRYRYTVTAEGTLDPDVIVDY